MASNQNAMSDPYAVVGNIAAQKPLPQSLDGDFLHVLTLFDGNIPNHVASNLTGSTFSFIVYGPDGSAWITKTVGAGITIVGNVVTILFDKANWIITGKVFLEGCQYAYKLNWVNANGFDKPLLKGKIIFA